MPIKFSEILLIYDLTSSGSEFEQEGFICTKTGKTFYHSNFGDNEEELPDDIHSNDQYVAVPSKRELGLGQDLVFDFIDTKMPKEYSNVRHIFSRKGAYSRFKSFLEEKGCLNEWYDYEAQCTEEALREWCSDEGIEIID